MSLQIADGARVRVSKVVKSEEKYTVVHLSSSDKPRGQEEYKYSNWAFARLVGSAHTKANTIKQGSILVLHGAKVEFVSYKGEDDQWKNPANPTLVIFDFELYNKAGATTRAQMPSLTDEVDENDIPF